MLCGSKMGEIKWNDERECSVTKPNSVILSASVGLHQSKPSCGRPDPARSRPLLLSPPLQRLKSAEKPNTKQPSSVYHSLLVTLYLRSPTNPCASFGRLLRKPKLKKQQYISLLACEYRLNIR